MKSVMAIIIFCIFYNAMGDVVVIVCPYEGLDYDEINVYNPQGEYFDEDYSPDLSCLGGDVDKIESEDYYPRFSDGYFYRDLQYITLQKSLSSDP
jgi:hypothetical protein